MASAQYDGKAHKAPRIAAEIIRRLPAAGRPEPHTAA
jgi:hypothetical protein